jgi:hypothetical protein
MRKEWSTDETFLFGLLIDLIPMHYVCVAVSPKLYFSQMAFCLVIDGDCFQICTIICINEWSTLLASTCITMMVSLLWWDLCICLPCHYSFFLLQEVTGRRNHKPYDSKGS